MIELLLSREGMTSIMSKAEKEEDDYSNEFKNQLTEKEVGLRVGRQNDASKLTTKKANQDDGLEE